MTMQIPTKNPFTKYTNEGMEVFSSAEEKEKMIDGLVLAIKDKSNRTNRYCWHHPFGEVDCTGIPSLIAKDVVATFAEKGWEVEVEDLSELDGTIVFIAR